ncbi:matrixin family metalloprotease [Streptomyces sp. NPDC006855]|uniref:matrixin family metalloprotease n=1 Tax=unclassified Streptomyces TaxID=2593676 RepID=UPI0036A41CE3
MAKVRNSIFRGITAGAIALGSIATFSPQASAYNLLGCSYNAGGNTLKWSNVTSSYAYSNPAQFAVEAWNSTSTQFNFTQVNSGANLRVADGNFGSNNIDGVLLDASGVDTKSDNPLLKCRNGYWAETNTAWLNRYYADSYSGAKKKSVLVHEIGHALGLGHRDTTSCWTTSIMDTTTQHRYDTCGLTEPTSDDIAGANALY